MKKKWMAAFLSLTLALGIQTSALAQVIDAPGNSGQTVLTYGVDSYYQVTIPEQVEFTKGETVKKASIIVDKDCLIPVANFLTVSLTGAANWKNNTLNLATETVKGTYADYTGYIPYTIKNTYNGRSVSLSNSALAEVTAIPHSQFASMTKDQEYILEFALQAEPTVAGDYTDTLTFTVALRAFK